MGKHLGKVYICLMRTDIQLLLRACFDGNRCPVRKLARSVSWESFMDSEGLRLMGHYNEVRSYVTSRPDKIIDASFERVFRIDNLGDPAVRGFLLDGFRQFSRFEFKVPVGGGYRRLFKDGVELVFKAPVGLELFPFAVSECLCYNLVGYDKGKEIMKEAGVPYGGGGTVADYINSTAGALRPLALEVITYLEGFGDESGR